MTARGYPLSALSPEQQAAVLPQLGAAPARRSSKPSPHTGTGAKKGMSKLEQRFAHWLDVQGHVGGVAAWSYEACAIRLPARRAFYRPDFAVRIGAFDFALPDGSTVRARELLYVETKPRGKDGRPYLGRASSLRARLAAEQLAGLADLWLVWPSGAGAEAGWSWERVEACS